MKPATAPPAAHFPALDAYRGIGMLMVLASHASFSTGSTGTALGPYLSRFELAVPMFFVLSGFLLYRPEVVAVLGGRPPVPLRRFWRRRALRILPAYWLAVAGVTVVWGVGPLDGPIDWLANLVVLQQFGADRPLRITQAWSIGVELSFYLLLPVYVRLSRRILAHRAGGDAAPVLLAGTGVLFALGTAFRVGVVVSEPDWSARSLQWLPMYLDFFALGMALSVVSVVSAQTHRRLPAPFALAGDHPAACWGVAGAIFVLVAQMDPPAEPFGLNGLEYLPRQAAYSLASAAWLAPAIFGDQGQGRLRQVLSSRPMAWLGAISLSFYLWHLDMIHQAKAWTVPDWSQRQAVAAQATNDLAALATFTGNFWVVAGLATACTLVVAAVAHRLVEVPCLELKDRPLRDLPEVLRGGLVQPKPDPTGPPS